MSDVNRIPFMFMRQTRGTHHRVFLVKMAGLDYRDYDAGWMDSPDLDPNHYEVYVPDVDLTYGEWLFDSGTSVENERAAFQKMKELWALVDFVPTSD